MQTIIQSIFSLISTVIYHYLIAVKCSSVRLVVGKGPSICGGETYTQETEADPSSIPSHTPAIFLTKFNLASARESTSDARTCRHKTSKPISAFTRSGFV